MTIHTEIHFENAICDHLANHSWHYAVGDAIKSLQSVMRHSDIKLTLDRYGHLFPGAEADAVARMREAFIQPARLTGTSDHPQQFQQQSAREGVQQGAKGRHSDTIGTVRYGHEKTLISQELTEKNQGLGAMRALGLEPRTQGLKVGWLNVVGLQGINMVSESTTPVTWV
jgi:hypothetical protein